MVPDLICDVGMHDGADTAYYLHRGYRVVAVEADPALVERATARFRDAIAARRLTILDVAIAEDEEPRPFWICEPHSQWNSFDRGIASRNGAPHHAITVRGRRLASVLAEHGVPYYLKVDIEGNDHLCIEALAPPDLPAYVSVELSDRTRESLDHLASVGYTDFKCISQFHFLPAELPPSAAQRSHERFRRLLDSRAFAARVFRRLAGHARIEALMSRRARTHGAWRFPPGSSGPFGEDTPGRWQSLAELRRTLDTLDAARAAGAASPFWGRDPFSFWADVHARLGPRRAAGR